DNSTDQTFELLEKLSNKINPVIVKANDKKLEGKKGALSVGIEKAKNNFIVITDADCKPEPFWLKEIAKALDSGYDFVFGVAPISSGNTLVEKLSAIEDERNTLLSTATDGINIP